MATLGCGCKICKANLGEYVNELITVERVPPKEVINILQNENVKVTEKLLKKHLSAYSIPYPENMKDETIICEPITVDLNKIDFSQYDFDANNIESIVSFLQKINLKILLNQQLITLKAQQDVIDGKCPDVPKAVLDNFAIAYQIFERSTAVNVRINQQQAIKTVTDMGLLVQQPTQFYISSDVQNTTDREAN